MEIQTLINNLEQANQLLTSEVWRQGSYFKLEDNKICMCPHGAIHIHINQIARESYKNSLLPQIAPRTLTASEYGYSKIKSIRNEDKNDRILIKAWHERPKWIRKYSEYGNYDAHYLLGLVGLTVLFNDNKNTTFKIMKNKFQQAIDLAYKLLKHSELESSDE